MSQKRGVGAQTDRWRWIGSRRYRKMAKLDGAKMAWIRRERQKGVPYRKIADTMGISVVWAKKLRARTRRYPARMGRPRKGPYGRREHSAALYANRTVGYAAVRLEKFVPGLAGLHIPHNTIHQILLDSGISQRERAKSRQRRYVRYERDHSNSLWHTDYSQLDDGRWLIIYEDDASRFITGYGIFGEATTRHAIDVLHEAIRNHGRPGQVMTDHGSQFYSNESSVRRRGEGAYERELARLGIGHVLSGVRHPQTNGKVERLFGEIKRKSRMFAGPGSGDGIAHFIRIYNGRPHGSLDDDMSPRQAFEAKMPKIPPKTEEQA